MSEEVTADAQHVISLAREEARRLNHNYIGTEHIVLGLIRQADGIAASTLLSLGASLVAAREQVVNMIGQGQLPPPDDMRFTLRAGEALALAMRAARGRGHDHVGSEHILLGITQLKAASEAKTLLTRLGINVSDVERAINRELDT